VALAVQRTGSGPDPDEAVGWDSLAQSTLSQSRPATADSVGRMRRAVGHFARGHGASAHALESVNLAVSEALTNVVIHAYRDAAQPGPVLIVAAIRDGALVVTVADEGCGMVPRPDSPGLGLGMGLIADAADTFEVGPRNPAPGLVLRMRFALAG
jgi:serine/threonine-protein kinase RsbW/stage II sporulation protein AB (anti-sigma F factor)